MRGISTVARNVVVRLSALLLLCIGIQIVWTGFSELLIPSAPSN
jgi:small neutral amino acid transporter SnatA (MarC family)